MKALLLLNFIIPVVMLLCGLMLKRTNNPYPGPAVYQVKWKVDLSGYNTPRARKSQRHWDYAQELAPAAFLRNGLPALAVAILCSGIGLLWEQAIQYPLWCLHMIFIGRAFRQVEKALIEAFGE